MSSVAGHLVRIYQMMATELLNTWSSGNVSIRDADADSIYIKPSGVLPGALQANDVSRLWLHNGVWFGLKPSTDTADHLYLYRKFPKLTSIIHTHSPYATAFAAAGRGIPCSLTAIADEFGGGIPCAPFARIGGEEIGKSVARWVEGGYPAVLLEQHGVMTFGYEADPLASSLAALKRAVMLEDCAKTVWLAQTLSGTTMLRSLPQAEIDAAHERYRTSYGQGGTDAAKKVS